MRMYCIFHADFEQPGYYETWAHEKEIDITSTHVYRGENLPSAHDYDILLVLGGPQSPLEIDKYPYLKEEIQFIKKAINLDKYVIGVCLGAQLVAESYGAKTTPSPHKEIGVFPIELTEVGKQNPNFKNFPINFLSGHWHNDMPGIPPGAEIIATSNGCPRQIVKFSPKVYGFQCHLEFNKQGVQALIESCPGDLAEKTYIQTADAILSQDYDEINSYLKLFLQNFIVQNES